MAMKCCTKLETAKERCPIVFQGHPSNFKVTRYKTSPILTQIGRFRTIGQSQLSNPSDLPCFLVGENIWDENREQSSLIIHWAAGTTVFWKKIKGKISPIQHKFAYRKKLQMRFTTQEINHSNPFIWICRVQHSSPSIVPYLSPNEMGYGLFT